MICIILIDPKGKECELEVNENDTIQKVKEQYFQKIGSNTNNQWKYDGRVIKDNNQTLKDLGIEDEDKLLLIQKLGVVKLDQWQKCRQIQKKKVL